jgi:hypothetical protein
MSVTITIKNNREYCAANNLVAKKEVPCGCAGYDNGLRSAGGDDNCIKCCGLGYVEKEVYPHEVLICEDNFKTLWNVFGFSLPAAEIGFLGAKLGGISSGEIDSRRVLKALKNTPLSLIVRGGQKEGDTIYCGINPEKAKKSLRELRKLAEEASRREEKIVWK